jgi:hypothetical protein
MTVLEDQILAGSLMWVFGIFACIIPAVFITLKLLSPREIQVNSSGLASPPGLPTQMR